MTKLTIETPEVFEPLLQPSRYKGAHGGRGSGKSHFFGELTIEEHLMYPGLRTMCIREVQKSLKESLMLLLSDKIKKMGVESMFNVLTTEIKTPGDGLIVFQGMQDHTADSIKSFENFNRSLCEESHTLSTRSLELLKPTIRNAGPAPMAERRFVWNPRSASDPVDLLLRGVVPPTNSIVIQSNYMNNPWFPQDMEEERLYDKEHNPDRYAHIWLGEYEPQAIGAIWTRQVLHENRLHKTEEEARALCGRIVVSVDPAVTDTETSDHHGIVVCGLGHDGRGYVLEDASIHGSPNQWATRAVAMYDKWNADAIVYERNQGGDMVLYTLQTVSKNISYIDVWAAKGKHVRAEPISALYSIGKISHVGTFSEMEAQLCKFTRSGYDGDDSPDRAEAMIWGMTELFPDLTQEKRKPKKTYQAEVGGWMG